MTETPEPNEDREAVIADPWSSSSEQTNDDPWQAVADTLEAVTGRMTAQSERVDVLEETVGELAGAVKQLMEQEKKKRKPRRYRFDALDAPGQQALWLEIAEFVDYLNSVFGSSAYSDHQKWRIPDWWWKQPIVVFELVALKAAWDEAFTSTTPDAPTTELIAWIDRWYWPCMNRIFNSENGLLLDQPPETPGTKFSVEAASNDRAEFDDFLDGRFGAVTEPPKEADESEVSTASD